MPTHVRFDAAAVESLEGALSRTIKKLLVSAFADVSGKYQSWTGQLSSLRKEQEKLKSSTYQRIDAVLGKEFSELGDDAGEGLAIAHFTVSVAARLGRVFTEIAKYKGENAVLDKAIQSLERSYFNIRILEVFLKRIGEGEINALQFQNGIEDRIDELVCFVTAQYYLVTQAARFDTNALAALVEQQMMSLYPLGRADLYAASERDELLPFKQVLQRFPAQQEVRLPALVSMFPKASLLSFHSAIVNSAKDPAWVLLLAYNAGDLFKYAIRIVMTERNEGHIYTVRAVQRHMAGAGARERGCAPIVYLPIEDRVLGGDRHAPLRVLADDRQAPLQEVGDQLSVMAAYRATFNNLVVDDAQDEAVDSGFNALVTRYFQLQDRRLSTQAVVSDAAILHTGSGPRAAAVAEQKEEKVEVASSQ